MGARDRTTPELRRMAHDITPRRRHVDSKQEPRNDVLDRLRAALREQERLAALLMSGGMNGTRPYEEAQRKTRAIEFELRSLLIAEET